MQLMEQGLQKSHLPHFSIILVASSEFKPFFIDWFFSIFINVKNGQGRAIDASGFRDIVVDAEEQAINLLKPPKDWNLK